MRSARGYGTGKLFRGSPRRPRSALAAVGALRRARPAWMGRPHRSRPEYPGRGPSSRLGRSERRGDTFV